MFAHIQYWIAYSRYQVLQAYYHLKFYDDLPFQLMHQDYEDRREVLVPPRKPRSAA